MYEIDKFGCFVLPKHDSDLLKAYRYYRTATICAEELSDELCYEEEERHFNVETYVRWYEAVEKALVIWLYYLGIRVGSKSRRGRGRVHSYHEAVLEILGHPDNPFFEFFNQDYLLDALREDNKIRNEWRHGWLVILDPGMNWEAMACYLSIVNAALGDALDTFSEIRANARELRAMLRDASALEKRWIWRLVNQWPK